MSTDREDIERELLLARCVERLQSEPGCFGFLVGAGMSVGSGIPLGGGIVTLLRQRLLEELQRDLSVEAGELLFRDLGWFQDPESEYSEALLRSFSSDDARQRFFRELISGKLPTLAHYYLANIVANGRCSLILTTNFDDLIEKALSGLRFDQFNTVTHGESTEYVSASGSMATVVKLHGHYTFPQLANLTEERQRLSRKLRTYFEYVLRDHGLIACGYAGRDRSVMEPIARAVRGRTIPKGMIWCIRRETDVSGAPYLRSLEKSGKGNVHFLKIDDADGFYRDLHERLGLPDERVLDALSAERYRYQQRRMLQRLSTGMSLDLQEEVIDRDLHYKSIHRRDAVDMLDDTIVSTRRLWVRNDGVRPVESLRHAEYGENKITHDQLSLTGSVGPDNVSLQFRPLNDPSMSFYRAFEMVLPIPLPPGAETEVEYCLSWPGEPSCYGQQPHSQSISLIRYRKGVGQLQFDVSVKCDAERPMTRAWALAVNEEYREREVVADLGISSRSDCREFSFSIRSPRDCLYVLHYYLGARPS